MQTKTKLNCKGRVFRRGETWWIAYYLRGKEFRESAKTDDEQKAIRFLKQRVKETGADEIGAQTFVTPQAQRLTVPDLLDNLERDYRLRGKHNVKVVSLLKPLRSQFAYNRAHDLTAEDVARYSEKLLGEGYAPASVNRQTQLLGQSFKLAVRHKLLNAMPYIQHLSEQGNARKGFFHEPEIRGVIANLPAYLRDFVLFAWLTGMRKGEIASLRWEDLEGDTIQLRAENAKNGNARQIPLVGELGELVKRCQQARQVKRGETVMLSEYLFHSNGEPIKEFRKSWATACRKACVQGRIFHDLRRSAVRNMVRAGVNQHVAMQISGHKTGAMFQRYNIVADGDLRTALAATQTHLKKEQAAVIEFKSGQEADNARTAKARKFANG